MFTYETYSHPSIYVEPLLCKTFGGPCRPRSVDFGRLQIRHCTPGGCCRCRWHHQIGEDVGAQATCFQQKPATKIISRCLKQNPPKEQNSLHHSETFRKRLRGVGNLSKRKGYFCHIWRNIVTLCIYICNVPKKTPAVHWGTLDRLESVGLPVCQDSAAQFASQEVEPQHRSLEFCLLHSGLLACVWCYGWYCNFLTAVDFILQLFQGLFCLRASIWSWNLQAKTISSTWKIDQNISQLTKSWYLYVHWQSHVLRKEGSVFLLHMIWEGSIDLWKSCTS